MPRAGSILTMPRVSRIDSASRSAARLTPSWLASARCAGIACPGASCPLRIISWMLTMARCVTFPGRTRSGPAIPV
jgi:hypothetical protein